MKPTNKELEEATSILFMGVAMKAGNIRKGVLDTLVSRLKTEDADEIKLFTVSDVSKKLGMSRVTVYKLIETGFIKAFKLAGGERQTRIKEADLLSYLAESEKTHSAV